MKFKQEVPQYYCIKDVPNFSLFLEHGQPEMCSFLVNFFGLDEVKVQCGKIHDIKKWLQVEEFEQL